ncbi:MAG: CDP-alcohol phosphatidyltransferase family protein [Candidatus Aminicenantes bacterium]|nr:CDP-alcohol phosphatidyltransferase family protein [Candidatus Aminicenantes bacterium]
MRTKTRPAGFRATLKEIEDVLDLAFNRFPAYLLVRALAPLRISPDALTAASFLLTCGSVVFLVRDLPGPSALFIYLKVIFDCSDGQMARFTKRATRFGVFWDELADISGQFLIFGGIGLVLMRGGFDWLIVLGLAASLFFMGADITLYQNFRTLYLRTFAGKAAPPPRARKAVFAAIDGLNALRETTLRIIPLPDINAYADTARLPAEKRDILRSVFQRRFRPMVYLFSLVAGTSHLFAIALLILLGRLDWIFPLFIVWYNALLAALIAIQIANAAAFERRYMKNAGP